MCPREIQHCTPCYNVRMGISIVSYFHAATHLFISIKINIFALFKTYLRRDFKKLSNKRTYIQLYKK